MCAISLLTKADKALQYVSNFFFHKNHTMADIPPAIFPPSYKTIDKVDVPHINLSHSFHLKDSVLKEKKLEFTLLGYSW